MNPDAVSQKIRMSEVFLSKVYTKPQAYKALRAIKDFINFRSFEAGQGRDFAGCLSEFEKVYSQKASGQDLALYFRLVKSYGEVFFNYFNPALLSDQLAFLERAIESAKTVMMRIPFEMPPADTEKIGLWFKANFGSDAMFDVMYDASLIGGCTLSFKGVEKDYSLRQRINQNKTQIIQALGDFRKN
jgi:hypothetical protein